jgi:hypothetical protein
LLTIKIAMMNAARKGLLKAILFNYDNNIILVGGTPLYTRGARIDILHLYVVVVTMLHTQPYIFGCNLGFI